ncbi:hypothetical protein P7C70_g9484, partial [Phenoliferia sp. Uapishka_3]
LHDPFHPHSTTQAALVCRDWSKAARLLLYGDLSFRGYPDDGFWSVSLERNAAGEALRTMLDSIRVTRHTHSLLGPRHVIVGGFIPKFNGRGQMTYYFAKDSLLVPMLRGVRHVHMVTISAWHDWLSNPNFEHLETLEIVSRRLHPRVTPPLLTIRHYAQQTYRLDYADNMWIRTLPRLSGHFRHSLVHSFPNSPKLKTLIVHQTNPRPRLETQPEPQFWSNIIASGILPSITKFISFSTAWTAFDLSTLRRAVSHLPPSPSDCRRQVFVHLLPSDDYEDDLLLPGNNQGTADLQNALQDCSVTDITLGPSPIKERLRTMLGILPSTLIHLHFEQPLPGHSDLCFVIQQFICSQPPSLRSISFQHDIHTESEYTELAYMWRALCTASRERNIRVVAGYGPRDLFNPKELPLKRWT